MIETISHSGGLGLRRLIARYMAGKTGKLILAPDNPRQVARARMNKSGDRAPCAPGVSIERIELAGRPALHFTPQSAQPGAIVFFHGGGYSLGSPQSHKPLVSRLSALFGLQAFSVDYRLAPEHVCPAAPEDGEDVLKQVRKRIEGPLIVAGDSAGGGLTLAAVLRHNDWDLLSLAALAVPLAASFRDPLGMGASVHSIAGYHLSRGVPQRAFAVLSAQREGLDVPALRLLAELHRRRGEWEQACQIWLRLAERDEPAALEALAKYYEHRCADHAAALDFAERLPPGAGRERRCGRLRARLAARAG